MSADAHGPRRAGAALAMMLAVFGIAGMSGAKTVERPQEMLTVLTARGDEVPFMVEIADTEERLRRGLMERPFLAADAGMLFDFKRPRPVSMWMKDTWIPLDMLYLDASGVVVHIEHEAAPGSLTPRPGPGLVRGVLELAGGTARRQGIAVGDQVRHRIFGAATKEPSLAQ